MTPGRSPCRQPTSILVVCLAALLTAFPRSGHAEEFRARVIGVADGDTLHVLHEGQQIRVRLHGIDAPEQGQPFGERANRFVTATVLGQLVIVRLRGKDGVGRALAEVFLADGRSLNRELVRAGYAWWFRQYSQDASLGELEAAARTARRGLWPDPHPVALWEWRLRQRTRVAP